MPPKNMQDGMISETEVGFGNDNEDIYTATGGTHGLVHGDDRWLRTSRGALLRHKRARLAT